MKDIADLNSNVPPPHENWIFITRKGRTLFSDLVCPELRDHFVTSFYIRHSSSTQIPQIRGYTAAPGAHRQRICLIQH